MPFSLVVGLSALMYYEAGVLMRQYKEKANYMLFCVLTLFWLSSFRFIQIDMVICEYSNYFLAFFVSLCGTMGIYLFSKGLLSLKSLRIVSYIPKYTNWIGRGSMVVLCAHTVERCYPLWQQVGITDTWLVFLCRMALCSFMLYLFCRIKFTRQIFGLEK